MTRVSVHVKPERKEEFLKVIEAARQAPRDALPALGRVGAAGVGAAEPGHRHELGFPAGAQWK